MSFSPLLSVAQWVSDSFPIIRIVLIVLMVVVGLGIILLVLFQPSETSGLGAISGDTYYSKNKGRSSESTLRRITVILGIVEAVLSILFFVSLIIYTGAAT